MFRCQRRSKPLLFRSRILLPNQLQHLPSQLLRLCAVRTSSRAAVLQSFGPFFAIALPESLGLPIAHLQTSSRRPPASASGPSLAPEPRLVEVPLYSSPSSSTGPPLEVAV